MELSKMHQQDDHQSGRKETAVLMGKGELAMRAASGSCNPRTTT